MHNLTKTKYKNINRAGYDIRKKKILESFKSKGYIPQHWMVDQNCHSLSYLQM